MNNTIEKILTELKDKDMAEIETEISFSDCEKIRHKMWDDYKIEIHEENKKIVLSVWRKK